MQVFKELDLKCGHRENEKKLTHGQTDGLSDGNHAMTQVPVELYMSPLWVPDLYEKRSTLHYTTEDSIKNWPKLKYLLGRVFNAV